MIPKEKKFKLIGLYMYICDLYKSSLLFYCQRFSNNSNPEFTDEGVLTVYLFCGYCQKYFDIKEIHTFAKESKSVENKSCQGVVSTYLWKVGHCSTYIYYL